jgi:hypothetical protein
MPLLKGASGHLLFSLLGEIRAVEMLF